MIVFNMFIIEYLINRNNKKKNKDKKGSTKS